MPDLTKAQREKAKKKMVRQKQQSAQEKKDIRMNQMRSENIMRRKKAAEKMGKTFSYKDITTPSAEGGPLNYGSPMKKSSCIKMYDEKGKQSGLMMEGSVAHMESMSPNKMDHGSMANYGSPLNGPGDTEKDKKKKAKTTLKNALASDEDYEVVPGFEERLGGELEGVTVTASRITTPENKQPKKQKAKEHIVYKTGAGKVLADINPFSRRKTYGGAKVRRVRR